MDKTKVCAEPRKRVKHVFGKSNGIHEGIHRDEPGWYDSTYHSYCFGYGYFFHQGKSLGKKLTPDYIKDTWDKAMWCGGIKSTCMAIINRERKIAVIRQDTEYAWTIEKGLPMDYAIYKTEVDIPIYDITEPKNKKVLIKMHVKYLIKQYLETFYHEYKVLNSVSKQIPDHSFIAGKRNEYFVEIKALVEKHKFIPRCKPLFDKEIWVSNYRVKFPSINAILNDTLFTGEQKEYIKKCKFYTKFCLHKGISWKELNKNWSDEYIEEVKSNDKVRYEAFVKLDKSYKLKAEANYKEALSKANKSIDTWREGISTPNIKWVDYYADYSNRRIRRVPRTIYNNSFHNTQLRLKPGKPNWVETSRGAIVPLETAINIFNQLYTDYILSGKTEFKFQYNQFRIGSFYVSKCVYIDKFDDTVQHKLLGYKEWHFTIGCHGLWFDDIKDFARYYNLQDRLSFPLDKTTAECMENHLIHLPSGRTIEAVGTIDI